MEQSEEIVKLKSDLKNAQKEKKKFINDTENLINSISSVEESLKSAKKELIKLK